MNQRAFVVEAAWFTPLLAWPRFSYPTSSVSLRFAPLKRCSGASVVRAWLSRCGGHTLCQQGQL